MRVLVAALLATIIAAVAMTAAQSFNWLVDGDYATINVEGVAEVVAIPDVGTFSFTVEAESAEVATAQRESGEAINAIMTYLQEEGGVADTDVKNTGYNTFPRYEFRNTTNCEFGRCPQERELIGYVVTQSVTVKVRETDDAGRLIGGVGERGATNMSNLSFEVDDIEAKKEEARLAAIVDAKAKAGRLANELDVRLGDILSFSDGSDGGFYPRPFESRAMMSDEGFGGDMMEAAFAPEIAVGEDTIIARVTITYELK